MTTSNKLWLGFGALTALLVLFSVTLVVRVWSIEALVKEQADVARPRSATAGQLEINVLDYALTVREYLASGDPGLHQEANEEATDVERERARYQSLVETDRQRELATRFAAMWGEMYALGQGLLAADSRAATRDDVVRFRDLRIRLEAFLDDEMQPEAAASYDTRRDATLRDLQTSVALALLLLVAGPIIAIGTSLMVGRGIVQTEHALRRAHDQLEDRVHERTAELAATTEALRHSNRELEQFASVASHDLQEPLRKIQAFGDRLQARCSAELGAQGREYLDRMLASAARMRRLIDDLLTFSRVATKAQPFVPAALNDAARDAVSDLEGRIEHSGGRVDVGELPALDADPSQMRQLLQNLIGNALKFHRPAVPPVVTVRGRLIEGGASRQAGNTQAEPHCEITVQDNGIGFDEGYRDRIFELFQRLHGRDEYEGTGMGLAICRKIVERHGGHITAQSRPGAGATFVVTLPIRRARADDAR